MEKSDSITKLAKALIEAQKEFEPIPKDSSNPYYKSKYASLDAVIAGTQGILNKHGLSVVQLPISGYMDESDKWTGVGLETILLHESGEFISERVDTDIPIPTNKEGDNMNPIQEIGKNLTYLRRYSIGAVLNLATEEDIDGEPKRSKKERKEATKPLREKLKETQRPYKWGELLEVFARNVAKKDEAFIEDPPSEKQVALWKKLAGAHLTGIFDDDTKRYEYFKALVGTASSQDFTPATLAVLLKWLKVDKFEDDVDGMALEEISTTMSDALKSVGQLSLLDQAVGEKDG